MKDAEALEHAPLAAHVVTRMMRRTGRWRDRDDWMQAALLALVLAARSFDPGRGVPFGPYAARCIKDALRSELRRADLVRLPADLRGEARRAAAEAARPAALPEELPGPDGRAEADVRAEQQLAESLLAALPRRRAELVLAWMGGESDADAGRRLGLSRQRVQQQRQKALDRMRLAARAWGLHETKGGER